MARRDDRRDLRIDAGRRRRCDTRLPCRLRHWRMVIHRSD
jgi:hypothetical protein